MDKQQWAEYWSGGALHSLAGDFAGNYTGKIAEFWRAEFQQLEPGARILDVATGNGAIALHALAVSDEQQKGFSVEACDLAAIEPSATVSDPELKRQLERIVFHPETNIEATDFDRGTFDLLTSQFGFEYANLSAGAKEIARLLSEQGRFAAIMHHPNSYILITTNGDRQQCRGPPGCRLAWQSDGRRYGRHLCQPAWPVRPAG